MIDLRKRRQREAQRRFIVEGLAEVRRAVHAGIAIDTLFVTENDHPDLIAAASSVVRLDGAAAARAFVRERGGDVIAIAESPPLDLEHVPSTDFAVLAESIEKPGNLGAMLRSADAAGVGAFVVCDAAVDPLSPNVVRASLGALFSVPVALATMDEAVSWCHERSMAVLALDPDGPALFDSDLTGPIALAVGAEHAGISARLRAASDGLVSIPMTGTIDSLNAATALAIGLFETVRQRSGLTPEA